MNQKGIQFNILPSEVRRLSGKGMSDEDVDEVLSTVENDSVLWGDIESAIVDAINTTKEKNK